MTDGKTTLEYILNHADYEGYSDALIGQMFRMKAETIRTALNADFLKDALIAELRKDIKELTEELAETPVGNTIQQGSKVYNPHHYEVTEKKIKGHGEPPQAEDDVVVVNTPSGGHVSIDVNGKTWLTTSGGSHEVTSGDDVREAKYTGPVHAGGWGSSTSFFTQQEAEHFQETQYANEVIRVIK